MLSSAAIVIQESTWVASTSPLGLIGLCAASFPFLPAMLKPTISAPALLRKSRREAPVGLNEFSVFIRSPVRNAPAP